MELQKGSSIVDAPRAVGEKDLLGLDNHAKALIRYVEKANTPITIAIQGEWGSGKTSMMNQLKGVLCDNDDSNFYGIWLNTWQYALLSDEELILSRIVTGLTDQTVKAIQKIYPSKYNENIDKVKGIAKSILKGVVRAGATRVAGDLGGNVVDEFTNSEQVTVTVNDLKDKLQDIIVDSIDKDEKKKGYIFFIDDLDRIEPVYAVQILELLKNIFEIRYCLFILAIDYDVVVKGLEPKFGTLTENNEREFRSFFDKIIQLPFTMPVSRYEIDGFIVKVLESVEYLTDDEINNHDFKVALTQLAEYSVGKNPRALKRLTNSLSLIKIFNEVDVSRDVKNDEPYEKIINIGLICCQIAYPFIYRMLNSEPDFKKWGEDTATRLKLKPLDDIEVEALRLSEEFDEEWEQILFRACQRDPYLSNNAYRVSLLLNLIADQVPDERQKELGAIVDKILSLSSVTNVESTDQAKVATVSQRSKYSGFDEFAKQLDPKNKNPNFVNLVKTVHDDVLQSFPDAEASYSPTRLTFFNNSFPRRKKSFIQSIFRKQQLLLAVDMSEANEDLPEGASEHWLERERGKSFCFELSKGEDYNDNVKKHIKQSYDIGLKGITVK